MLEIDLTDPYYQVKAVVLQALHEVIDPELGINIVDLGLVYDLEVTEKKIYVYMTLSTPSCPMGGMITAHAKLAADQAAMGRETYVQLVWEPKWNASMMSETARIALGW